MFNSMLMMAYYEGWKVQSFNVLWKGILLGSVCDHILTYGWGDFLNCQIKNPPYDSDNKKLIGTLRVGKKVSSRMLCRLTNSGGQHRRVMQRVGHGLVGIAVFKENKEGSAIIFFESVPWIISLR